MRGQLRIEHVSCWIVLDEDGTEGVPAVLAGDTWLPLFAADDARLESIRPAAQAMAAQGLRCELVRFSQRELLEVLEPPPGVLAPPPPDNPITPRQQRPSGLWTP